MKLRLIDSAISEVLNSEFSVEARLVTASPASTKYIRVIFHSQFSAEDILETSREAYLYWVDCYYDDIVDVKQNDKITIDGVEYNIESVENRTDSWSTMRLTRV